MMLGTQIYNTAAETLGPEPRAFEVEMANEKLKRLKLPSTDQITAESIKARGKKKFALKSVTC